MKLGQVRAFVRHRTSGQIGVLVTNDTGGGVFRGHFDGWFGSVKNGEPIVLQVLASNYEEIPAPTGRSVLDADKNAHTC